jgi:hypothetical protein
MATFGVVECAGLAMTGVCIAQALTTSQNDEKEYHFTGQKYDPVYNYYRFSPDYTQTIDLLLADPKYGEMDNKIVVNIGKYIPDLGYHILYTNGISNFFTEIFTYTQYLPSAYYFYKNMNYLTAYFYFFFYYIFYFFHVFFFIFFFIKFIFFILGSLLPYIIK